MSKWQAIETAPKDGNVYLGFDRGDGVNFGVIAIRWVDADEDDPDYGEYWHASEIGSGDELYGVNLTHWQPLPEPPK